MDLIVVVIVVVVTFGVKDLLFCVVGFLLGLLRG